MTEGQQSFVTEEKHNKPFAKGTGALRFAARPGNLEADEQFSEEETRLRGFATRHIGPGPEEQSEMLRFLGMQTLEDLIRQTLPADIRLNRALNLPAPLSEEEALHSLRKRAEQNTVLPSFLGFGYANTYTPPVIRRNVLENPGWYTAYTPYQAEIAQGRLEALLNFQTMICDLTGMEICNASLLDESTAAAEAMAMCHTADKDTFLASPDCHPQTLALLRTRAQPLGIRIVVEHPTPQNLPMAFGVLLQYPTTGGKLPELAPLITAIHEAGAQAVVAVDLLALTLLQPPGEVGADIVVGSTQRFGVPLGYGGPHAAFLATLDIHKRRLPGRLVGVSRDAHGNQALRLTLQTREQHIRREKATSNICTAQVLLAAIASFYAVWHGPKGLRDIAHRIHLTAVSLADELIQLGYQVLSETFFDTLLIRVSATDQILSSALAEGINLCAFDKTTIAIALDETTHDLAPLLRTFGAKIDRTKRIFPRAPKSHLPASQLRTTPYLQHPVFNSHHTETEMLRYLRRLEAKDLSLTTSMIPLGSCTMKLNATSEMLPVTWSEFSALHPFAPTDQTRGYQIIFRELETWLAEITGFAATSLQPNAGSQGEYAGLLVIRAYHHSRGDQRRDVCLIPVSAHGTNPASAAMAGMRVVPIACDTAGNVDIEDLRKKAIEYRECLAALMVTYPSTHGVFETGIHEICSIVHHAGGQVYMDGANMNAQVGLCRPGDVGADVCHLNLHKTFCIPHGGGGPGVGPICVAAHLAPFLPGHSLIPTGGTQAIGEISQAPWGSASILIISWMYIAMMGAQGLRDATGIAILNANYIATRLAPYFPILYKGIHGRVAHECIIDVREWKERAGIEVEDIAKRLIDFGFHAPTMSWPVPGTLMIEPTESESKAELDRFCDALIAIHEELIAIESGQLDRKDNPLKNAPHTASAVSSDEWKHPYSRQLAAYPAPWLREFKFWPAVGRIDNVYGDRHVFCTCGVSS